MRAGLAELISSGLASAPSSRRMDNNRDDLLNIVRDHDPELRPKDAFELPNWFPQQRQWVEDPAGSDSVVYNYPLLLRISGPLNVIALQQSLQEIVRRHEVLHSVFRVIDGKVIQIVVAPQEFSLPVTRLDGSPEAREQQMKEIVQREAMQPFDLERGPMLRGQLMRMQQDDYFLQLTTHTILYDDWSTGVVIRELLEMYTSFAAGGPPTTTPLPFQYGDFIRWQRTRLQGPEFESHLDFWRQQLNSATTFEHLATDFVRPSSNAHMGAKLTTVLPEAQVDSLKRLCRQERVSLFMVLLAGFKCVLHRYSGHNDIGIGSCAGNRALVEVEGLIGRFGNTMVLRTDLTGNPSFSELLRRVREVTLIASSHLEVPFGMLLGEIDEGIKDNPNLPFQVMFTLQNAPKEIWQLPGLKVDWLAFDPGTAKLDLIVWLKTEPTLEITLEYNTQLFEHATMNKLLADFQAVLAAMAKDPKGRVNSLGILAKPEPVEAKPARSIVNGSRNGALQPGILTHDFKADRESLAKPDGVDLDSGNGYVAPRNDWERGLVEIWQTVLRRERVGVRENFFDLGGHSLLAVIICSRIRRKLGLEVSLRLVFENPTVEQLSKQLVAMGGHSQHTSTMEMTDRQKPLPASFGQQGMWLLHQTLPDPATYNEPVAWRLSGPVEGEKVRRALQAMMERHEILRTALVQQGENLVQEVTPAKEVALPWQEMDLQGLPPSQEQTVLEERLLVQTRQPFELGRAPLWRVAWVKLATEEHVLALTFHHSIMDEWSMRVFCQELERLYDADGHTERAGLAELPLQYADFAAWQRRRLSGDLLEQQRNYWKEQLRELPPALELPVDGGRTSQLTSCGEVHDFRLTGPVVEKFRELAREEGATLFSVLLTAFQVWLHRYTGQNDVVVGTPVTNRRQPEFETMLGFFLNTLPLRVRLEGSVSFREALKQVHQSFMGAISHADLPFEQMVEMVVKERKMGQQPLYQVMFVLLEEGLPALHLDQTQCQRVQMRTGTSKNDLMLSIEAREEAWECRIAYATDLFTAERVARMAGHLTELLASITEDAAQPISRLRLLSAGERQQLLEEWNDTKTEHPGDKCIHQLFEEQVERTPVAVAVMFERQTMTYSELNARANQLAHHLRLLGVGPDVLVGLCVERSLEMVVALLAILKAGGAYVPIDPQYPNERITFMLQDSKATVLLTQNEFVKKLGKASGQIVCLDTDREAFAVQSRENPPACAGLENLIYAIYTSGSTGSPKGARVYHRGFTNLMHWFLMEFAIGATDNVLLVSSLSFDLTQKNIYATLLCGGKLHLLPGGLYDPGSIADSIQQNQVTLLNCTPSAFYPLIEAPGLENLQKLNSLRCVFLGGEPISVVRLRPWLQQEYCRAEVANTYGPTECTDIATYYRLNRSNLDTHEFVPTGKPIFNVQLAVVNGDLQLCPAGVAGELCVAGVGVGAGYFNSPELTASKFIPNPFPEISGEKLYKTGDLVRYLVDGNIEYLGRLDHQVKFRGFRIELGEIEAVLAEHSGVREAVVVSREDVSGDKQLVAYFTAKRAEKPNISELRSLLGTKLPEYMVPNTFVWLNQLPLTPNGKVDRKALEKLEGVELATGTEYVTPRNQRERELAEIWQAVLRRERVGVHDNFFNLGGHSLLAVRLISEINRVLKLNLAVRALFQNPTIAELARSVPDQKAKLEKKELIQLQRGHVGPELIFILDEGSLGLFRLAHFMDKDVPLYASVVPVAESSLRASAKKKVSAFPTMQELAAEHVALIGNHRTNRPLLLAGHCFGGVLAFEVAQQLQRAGKQVEAVVMLDTWMTQPHSWWRRKAWLQAHVRELLQQGPGYILRKSRRRIILEKEELLLNFTLMANGDFTGLLPRAIMQRIYHHAFNGYQPQVLASRGMLFISKDDWLSNAYRQVDNSLGVAQWFSGKVEVMDVPGDHVTVLDEPLLPKVAECLGRGLAKLR